MSYRDSLLLIPALIAWLWLRFLCVLLGHRTIYAADVESIKVYSVKVYCNRCGRVELQYTRVFFKRGAFTKTVYIRDIKPVK